MDLDRWITGNYGEDQFADAAFCKDCICWDRRGEPEGGYCNKHAKYTDLDDCCEDIEVYDPRDDEPQDTDKAIADFAAGA